MSLPAGLTVVVLCLKARSRNTYPKDLVLGLVFRRYLVAADLSVFNLWESGTNCSVWTQDSSVGAIATTRNIWFCLAVAPVGVSLHELCRLCQSKTIQRRLWVCLLQANSVGCRGRHNSKKQKVQSWVLLGFPHALLFLGRSQAAANQTKQKAKWVTPKVPLKSFKIGDETTIDYCEDSFGRSRISHQTCKWKILMLHSHHHPVSSVVYLFLSNSNFRRPVKGLSGPPNSSKIDAFEPLVSECPKQFLQPKDLHSRWSPSTSHQKPFTWSPSMKHLAVQDWLRGAADCFWGVHPGFIMVLDVTWWSWRSSATQRSFFHESQTCASVLCFPEPSRSPSAYTWPSWMLFPPPLSPCLSSSMSSHEGSSLLQGHNRHLAIHGMHQDGISNLTTT